MSLHLLWTKRKKEICIQITKDEYKNKNMEKNMKKKKEKERKEKGKAKQKYMWCFITLLHIFSSAQQSHVLSPKFFNPIFLIAIYLPNFN